MAINAIIWDLGGVLVRTSDYASRDALAARHGMERAALEELVYGEESGHQAQLGLIDVQQHWENVRTALGIPFEDVETFRGHFWRGDQLDGELVDFIRSLKGKYRTGLLSNAFSNLRQVIQETWHIEDAFDAIVISAEEGLIKPDPRIYQVALDRLGVKPREAVFIDDMLQNVEGARRMEMHAIHFRSPEQARREVSMLIDEDHH
jgi:epoxide hydrolase-like predicted phosphatase